MRILPALWVARGNPKEPVPFQEILPLKLKGSVSGKGDKTLDVCCIQEMSILFACLKQNEFNEKLCSKEIQSFQNCYTDYMQKKSVKKQKEAKGLLTPGEKKLSHKQVNKLLKSFPNVK